MAKNEGSNVDAEVKNELLSIELRLNTMLKDLVDKLSDNLMTTVEKVFNKDIDHINEKLNHFQSNHREHYENDKDRRADIDELEKKITAIQIEHSTESKIDEKQDRKREMNYGAIGVLCAIACVITAIVTIVLTK